MSNFIKESIQETFAELDISCYSVMSVYKSVLDDPQASNKDKMHAAELFVKWLGLAAPDIKDIRVSGLDIAIEAPEDLDI